MKIINIRLQDQLNWNERSLKNLNACFLTSHSFLPNQTLWNITWRHSLSAVGAALSFSVEYHEFCLSVRIFNLQSFKFCIFLLASWYCAPLSKWHSTPASLCFCSAVRVQEPKFSPLMQPYNTMATVLSSGEHHSKPSRCTLLKSSWHKTTSCRSLHKWASQICAFAWLWKMKSWCSFLFCCYCYSCSIGKPTDSEGGLMAMQPHNNRVLWASLGCS